MKRKYYTTWSKLEEDSKELLDVKDEIVAKIAKKLNINKIAPLGNGNMGYAYHIPNNRVLKITTDRSEAAESFKLKGKNLKHLANIYDVYNLGGAYEGFYIIISEYIDRPEEKLIQADELLYMYANAYKRFSFHNYNKGQVSKEEVKDYIYHMDKYMSEQDMELAEWLFLGKLDIIDELRNNNVDTEDYGINNLGVKKNGSLAMFDLGFGTSEPQGMEDMHLNENTYTPTEFSDILEPKLASLARRGMKQFTGKDGNTYYINSSDNPTFIRVYKLEGGMKPIGYLYLHPVNLETNTYTPDAGNNFAVHVEPEYRRLGLGSAMYDYAESLGYKILPSKLQQPEAEAMWKKRKPELREFWGPGEFPDFLDGQYNSVMADRAFPPTMNMNTAPLAEEMLQEKRRVSDKTVNYLLDKMGLEAQYFNSGGYGDAFISSDKVIKFTTDFNEARLAQKFASHHFKHVANIEKVVKFKESKDSWIYVIILEKLKTITETEKIIFRAYEKAMGAYGHMAKEVKNVASFPEVIESIGPDYSTEYFDPWVIRGIIERREGIIEMYHIINYLKWEVSQVMSSDKVDEFLSDFHWGNMGKKQDGTIAFFDLQWLSKEGHPQDVERIYEREISSSELNMKNLPYEHSRLFDDFVTEKTEAEIREIAPDINLRQNLQLLMLDMDKNYPELFDNFAQWLSNKLS